MNRAEFFAKLSSLDGDRLRKTGYRSKREAKAAQKQAAMQRQRAAEEFVRDVTERFDQIVDPDTPRSRWPV